MPLIVLLVVFGFFAAFSLAALIRDYVAAAVVTFLVAALISLGILASVFPA